MIKKLNEFLKTSSGQIPESIWVYFYTDNKVTQQEFRASEHDSYIVYWPVTKPGYLGNTYQISINTLLELDINYTTPKFFTFEGRYNSFTGKVTNDEIILISLSELDLSAAAVYFIK